MSLHFNDYEEKSEKKGESVGPFHECPATQQSTYALHPLQHQRPSSNTTISQFCSLRHQYCPFSKPDKDSKSAPMCFYQAWQLSMCRAPCLGSSFSEPVWNPIQGPHITYAPSVRQNYASTVYNVHAVQAGCTSNVAASGLPMNVRNTKTG